MYLSNFRTTKLFFLIFLFCSFTMWAQDELITVWKTDNPGSSNDDEITINIVGDFYYEWVDENDSSNSGSGTGYKKTTINFGSPGTYKIFVERNGSDDLEGFYFGNYSDAEKLLEIIQWGDIKFRGSHFSFRDCTNLEITATDTPDVSNVTYMHGAFENTSVDYIPGIGSWDVSSVEDMGWMFKGAENFNQSLDNWDVGNVTNMSAMFYEATSFNGTIGSWDVSNVKNMGSMFRGAENFNQNLNNWDVSKVEDMSLLFSNASSFNGVIGNWDVSSVENMLNMFFGAESFNQNITDWNVSNVEDMSGMFNGASSFNRDIGNWDILNVEKSATMFSGATSFNQDLNNWDVSNISDFSQMFQGASSFNGDISDWDVSNGDDMVIMFSDAEKFNQDISGWVMNDVLNIAGMFYGTADFDQDLGAWKLNNVSQNGGDLFKKSGMSCENYSRTLEAWADNSSIVSGFEMNAEGMEYSPEVADARDYLINNFNWEIEEDSEGNCTLSTDVKDNITFEIFPNPVENMLHIETRAGNIQTIELFSITGKRLQTWEGQSEIDLSSYAAGNYFVKISTADNQSMTKQVIKK